jgi:vacuolar-type H+-ATPase subunit H
VQNKKDGVMSEIKKLEEQARSIINKAEGKAQDIVTKSEKEVEHKQKKIDQYEEKL